MDMMRGLERFRAHFAGHEESYALIGGAACDIILGEAGLPFRATKDLDMVLCVEAVSTEFGMVFADFLEAGGYRARERSTGRREFYRFHHPADETFSAMIELFARHPNVKPLPEGTELSPISVEENVISLSAILLDKDYFEALQNMRIVMGGISLGDGKILIPFKVRAFLDLSKRKAEGENIDARHIRKHRGDVFRWFSCCRTGAHWLWRIPYGLTSGNFSSGFQAMRISITRLSSCPSRCPMRWK